MPKTKAAGYIRGKSFRATRLDECGNPVVGADSVVVSKSYVSIAFTSNTEDGEAIDIKNADNERSLYQAPEPRFVNYGIEFLFTKVDPEVFKTVTGNRLVVDYDGTIVGFTVDSAIKTSTVNLALEVWVGTPPGDTCSDGDSTTMYGYLALPFVQGGTVGDFTVQNGEITFSVTGAVTKDGNRFGRGLYNVMLDAAGEEAVLVDSLISTDHLLQMLTPMAPPAPHIGSRPYMTLTDPEITAVTATPTLLSVEFSPTPSGTEPFWIDYGDGVWSYSSDGSALTHVYEEAGTYTYTARRGSSAFTDTVTVAAV